MHTYLVDGEMLPCMPMEMIIDGPNLKKKKTPTHYLGLSEKLTDIDMLAPLAKKKCIFSIYTRFLYHCFTSFHSKTIYSPFPLIYLSDNAFLSDHFLNKML